MKQNCESIKTCWLVNQRIVSSFVSFFLLPVTDIMSIKCLDVCMVRFGSIIIRAWKANSFVVRQLHRDLVGTNLCCAHFRYFVFSLTHLSYADFFHAMIKC